MAITRYRVRNPVFTPLADLEAVWSTDDIVLLMDQNTQSVLTLTNLGPETAQEVSVTFLASGTSISSIEAGPAWTCSTSLCTASSLNLDAEVEFSVSYTSGSQGKIELNADAQSLTLDPVGSDNAHTLYQSVSEFSTRIFYDGFESF